MLKKPCSTLSNDVEKLRRFERIIESSISGPWKIPEGKYRSCKDKEIEKDIMNVRDIKGRIKAQSYSYKMVLVDTIIRPLKLTNSLRIKQKH